jgi:hypothetical protein
MVKRKSTITIAISFTLLMLLTPLAQTMSQTSNQLASQTLNQSIKSPAAISTDPCSPFQRKYIDPELLNSVGLTRVLVVASDNIPPNEIAKYMISSGATPSFKGFYIMVGVMHADNVELLASDPRILAILKDRKVEYSVSTDIRTTDSPLGKNLFILPLEKDEMGFGNDSLAGKPETTLREVANITGAKRAWTDLGINGTDVTIAIVDTGVDYGALGLGYWDTVARDKMGYPAAFDADAECMAITNTTVTATYMVGTGKYLNTSGIDPDVYLGAMGPLLGMSAVAKFSNLTGSLWPADMEITSIISRSGNYHFGVMIQYWNMVPEYLVMQVFPVLVVDSITAGVYDTVYVDLSFDWAWLSLISSYYPEVLPHWPGTWPPEYSFADETPITAKGLTVAARDFTGDGINDLSAGSLGYFLDVWEASPDAADRRLVLKPIDTAGNYTVFVNDWFGHGTYCAGSAGGRDSGHLLAGSGIAPGAKIMGIDALWIGDIIEAELWAAGFDLIPGTEGWSNLIPGYGTVWGTWNYTGNHKADIISNSWGLSEWAPGLQGLYWYDLLTILEDALMVPGYLDPNYPGTVVVQAGGNGAPGYGTFTSPGYATLPISAGASTSFGTTASSLFGVEGGYYDDVIPWSATGPTPQGNAKPDVVNVGAWAWVPGPVWSGLGDGWNAFSIFGGTSMATPLTSGSVALLIQGYATARAIKPTPETAKVILKSTAKDLGYDVFLQGSGRVDCFAAVSSALGTSGVITTSPITWENVRSEIQYSWSVASEFFGYPLQVSPPTGPINDVSWFAGVVRPGNSTSAEFTITNLANDTISATITPSVYEHIGSLTIYSGKTGPLKGWLEGYGDQFTIDTSTIPSKAELMEVALTVPYSYFDLNGDYEWDNRFRIFILDWIDSNHNGVVDPGETFVVNYGYNTGTSVEARVGFPLSKFKGEPLIWISQVSQTGVPYAPVPYKVYVSYYKRDNRAWTTMPANITVKANSSESFTAKLTVPPETAQGIYEGQIILNITTPYTRATVIPVSLAVPMVLPEGNLSIDITPPNKTELYDPYRVNGYFDWRWRYEAGDWKVWLIDIQDPSVVAAFVSINWTGKMTDIDMFVINPPGVIVGNATSPYLGNGCFEWATNTNAASKYVAFHTSNPASSPVPGIYTILLHNVLFDGAVYPENVTGRVELVKLIPREPVTLPVKPGNSGSFTFTLTTGRTLSDISIGAYYYTQFLVNATPSFISEIPAMGSESFTVTVTIPEDTPTGIYPVVVEVFISELMGPPMYMPVIAFINVVADNTPPIISMVSPTEGEVIGGAIKIQAYARDDVDTVKSAEYSIVGGPYTNMTLDAATGLWTTSVDTTKLPDGAATLLINATDRAGNSGIKEFTLTIDNTKPTAEITVPDYVRGTVPIAVNASDQNFDRAELYVSGELVETWTMPGAQTYSWNTTELTDGAYLVKLIVYDKAGNMATNETSVMIDNTMPIAEIRAPLVGSHVRGTYHVTVYGQDVNLDTLELYVNDSLVKTLTMGGVQTHMWGTATLTDGAYTVKLVIRDKAGNAIEDTVTVTVDNTPPTVSITAPAAGAELLGTVTIQFTASDANPDEVFLYIDNAMFNVTGTTSYRWATTTLGDGSHTIRLAATDRAGNSAEKSIAVVTVNVRCATEDTRNTYLATGLPIGLVIGALVAYALLRRRKVTETK